MSQRRDGEPRPVVVHWSGGKDAALALHVLREDPRFDVVGLATMMSAVASLSLVHDLPLDLLQAQARSIGLPLEPIPVADDLRDYDEAMRHHATALRRRGIRHVAFGDLRASGAMTHRRRTFAPAGVTVVNPLYELSSKEVVAASLDSGIRSVCVVADAGVLSHDVLGRPVDAAFIAALPPTADPAGEMGEYHTFVHDAAWFASPVPFVHGTPHLVRKVVGTTHGPRTYGWWTLPVALGKLTDCFSRTST